MPSSDIVELLSSWPQPGTGNAGPVIRYGPGALKLAYETPVNRVAVVTVPLCLQFVCGHPNDEVLQSHPLYARGLQFYSVHRVSSSSWLAAIEKANSVHPRHDPATFLKDKEHLVFTFQDETVEVLALIPDGRQPSFIVCDSWAEANALLASEA